ncbi:hypothetical protein [Halorarius litoreus]|uniref:hypothetical protein n=1 Tax=Halorarius litoreus TaxID=2962676 RepID=UPI0020CE72DC|nr:hypothetical protein [Halorarius litoreus]
MSTAGRQNASAPAESLAAAVRDAGFVRLAGTADGDALAAVGVLARAFRTADIPFQASVSRFPRDSATEADVVVGVGTVTGDVSLTEGPLSVTAFEAAQELGDDPDPLLALAGAVAGGATPGQDAPLYEAAESTLDRRPGVALPVADLADGLAHTTLVHAGFSGDTEATTAALAELGLPPELDDAAHRRLASMVALRAIENASDRAGEAVERALRPYAGGPFETLGGYADVLDACSRVVPGTGVALALGHEPDGVLDAWRDHGAAAHDGLANAETARHDGVFVVHVAADPTDVPLGTVARLAHAYRSPEPLVVALGGDDGGEAAVHGDRAFALAQEAAAATGAQATGRETTGYVRDIDSTDAFTDALREAL